MKPEMDVVLRSCVHADDEQAVRRIVSSSGFFTDWEEDMAVSLVQEHRERGAESGYEFLFAEVGGLAVGFACYGPSEEIPALFDLYWIGVLQEYRGRHVGRMLLNLAEDMIIFAGGQTVRIETSAREQYAPTRAFYESFGYVVSREDVDFYAPGESRLTYTRELATGFESGDAYNAWGEYCA
jgi:ribosomal protein S18 acetylase RimI-like enzyme